MGKLANDLIRKGYLKNDLIIDAFFEISRVEFVPKELEKEAEADIPLPIGYGQTISQPATVATMLELLEPERGHKVLDIGSGSGWTAALLSYAVGKEGKVIAVERNANLLEFGKNNAEKFGYVSKGTAEFICADGSKGYSPEAPYDRILVSASAEYVPDELKAQLKIGGKMVIPILHSVWYLEKRGEDDFLKEEYPGFSFVPLIIK
ncbi:MAG TPA: protein-L-isoaspartate O-methyltransferase [Candidatus Moranbacteria bacterium]|nr:protein-L-isoaspartate O-methyltransferase [Candidatus Moranbacteria bacterium]